MPKSDEPEWLDDLLEFGTVRLGQFTTASNKFFNFSNQSFHLHEYSKCNDFQTKKSFEKQNFLTVQNARLPRLLCYFHEICDFDRGSATGAKKQKMAAKGSTGGFDVQAHRDRELERLLFTICFYMRRHCLLHVSGTYLLHTCCICIAAAKVAPFTIFRTCTQVLYYALSFANVLLMCF